MPDPPPTSPTDTGTTNTVTSSTAGHAYPIFRPQSKFESFKGDYSQNPEVWIEEFQTFCALSGVHKSQYGAFMANYLEGAALLLYKAHRRYLVTLGEFDSTGWGAWQTWLLNEFGDANNADSARLQLQQRKLKPKESLSAYYAEILSLCSIVDSMMNEKDKMSFLVNGLPQDLRTYCIMSNIKTVSQFNAMCAKLHTVQSIQTVESTSVSQASASSLSLLNPSSSVPSSVLEATNAVLSDVCYRL